MKSGKLINEKVKNELKKKINKWKKKEKQLGNE